MVPEAALTQHRSKLLALDYYFAVDLALVEHISGASGAAELQRLWMNEAMPTETSRVSLEEAVRMGKTFLAKPLFRYAGSIAQGTIRTALEMLTNMELGKAPSDSGAKLR